MTIYHHTKFRALCLMTKILFQFKKKNWRGRHVGIVHGRELKLRSWGGF